MAAAGAPSAFAAEPGPPPPSGPVARAHAVPVPDHVMVVVLENKDAADVIGSTGAPYLTSLAARGANFTDAHAETHPSQPNYLALFSGDTHGVNDDHCPVSLSAPNLGGELLAAGRTFVGYSEDLPRPGATVCIQGDYARKHSPWVDFSDLPAATNAPLSALEPDYSNLPTVAFVTPNMCHDMHDCGVRDGDTWMKQTIDRYLSWAQTHNSLLIVTFDEADVPDHTGNTIATVLAGPMVEPGSYTERIDHYSILRTIQDMYGLAPLGHSADAAPITGIWNRTA
ncbi:acid phosphatase [Pseudonocardia sp. K10HN5]|uniref:Acid phosphatase n=2 Tax=Pseudonocardia acidicola TaxID=2724939 RepID=A0ABX1SKU1_9PSEU|nr:alkaline phosphatase family protein [Pseudonocardia acidicola]NMI01012.1 acid phosphatase [Pseudonocardia acidicola]